MQSAETTSPYPGPRPFTAAERDRFFGRTRELQDLAALVIAQPVTVLYGPTGAGKTSLICAGVIPELERADFDVLPLARVGGLLPPGTDAARLRNVFTYSVLLHWAPDGADDDALTRHTLASYLRAMPGVDDGVQRPKVIVLDQLEDLFTAYPAQWEQREAFLRELGECVRGERSERGATPGNASPGEPPMRLLLAIRDSRLADLERHAALFPDDLRARLPLDGLRVPAAMEAISGPAGNLFSGTDAEQLARNLAQRRVRLANGKLALIASDRVEPMQLQLACDERFQRGGRGGPLGKPRDPDEALTRFYDVAVARARAGFRSERKLRRFVADRLLTPEGARNQALRGPRATAGLANKLVDALERERLIRSETRGGRTWVELAHDRLVPAIHLSNLSWSESQVRRRRAWRFVLFMLLFAAVVVGLAYLGKLGYARWQEILTEKTGLEEKLTTLGEGEEALAKQLARTRGELAGEQRRAQLAGLGEQLRTLARDAQLLQTVVFDMGRYRPSARDVELEAETLINFVASGQELARVGMQVQALGASQQQLLADIKTTAAAHEIDELEDLFSGLGDAAEELAPELLRLQKSVTAMTTDFGRYSTRLAANLDGWESPPRPGASLEARIRETSRGQWRAGFRAWLANDIAGARSRLQKAIERDPSNPAPHEALARLSWSEGQFAAADKDFRAALAQDPEYGPALAGMSAVYLHDQALADADRCVRRALAVQPDFAAAHFILGEVGHRLAQPDVKFGKVSRDNPCKKRAAPAPTDPAAPVDPAAAPAEPAPAE